MKRRAAQGAHVSTSRFDPLAKTMSGWSRRRTRYRTAVEAVVWLEDDEADLSVEVVVLSEVGEDHFCAAPGRSAAAAVKCGFGGERGADERSAGGGIGASGRHGLYAPGSGEAARRQRRGVHRVEGEVVEARRGFGCVEVELERGGRLREDGGHF